MRIQAKPRGMAQRLDALERVIDAAGDDDVRAFWETVDDYALSRSMAYGQHIKAQGMPCGLRGDASTWTEMELNRLLKPHTELFLAVERPITEALNSAPKPLTMQAALQIVEPLIPETGLSFAEFAAWMASHDFGGGFNYLRELNGKRPYGPWEFHCLEIGRPDLIGEKEAA